MGFLTQDVPPLDFEKWRTGTRAERMKPMARHWAEAGFGAPVGRSARHVWLSRRDERTEGPRSITPADHAFRRFVTDHQSKCVWSRG
jgi:Transmembrane protein of unknown function (DUF3556)